MSQKRHPEDGRAHRSEGNSPEDKRRKVPAFKKYELVFYLFICFCLIMLFLTKCRIEKIHFVVADVIYPSILLFNFPRQ